jgi:hypothetical protein
MVFPEPVASSGRRARFSAGTSPEDSNFVTGGTVSPPTPGSVAPCGSAARAVASVVPSADIAGTRGSRRRRGVKSCSDRNSRQKRTPTKVGSP